MTQSTVTPSTWMTDTWATIGNKPLWQVAMPGSHDAGMYTLSNSTTGSNACNTQTQQYSIAGQLGQGSRYFDLRPVIWSNGTWYLGHFGAPAGGWVGTWGSTGETLAQALQDVQTFATANPSEIIILKFSHYMDYKSGTFEYADWYFTADQQQQLINTVQDALDTLMYKSTEPSINLNNLTLSQIKAVGNVICVFDELDEDKYDANGGIFRFTSPVGNIPVNKNKTSLAPAIAVNPNGQDVYCMYTNSDHSLYLTTSSNGGKTWNTGASIPMNGTQTTMAPGIVCGPDGTLYCIYANSKNSNKFIFNKSGDGGTTWLTTPVSISAQWSSAAPAIAIDPATGYLYIFFFQSGKNNTLFCISTDGGSTWSVNYDSMTVTSESSPTVAIGEYNGHSYIYLMLTNSSNKLVCVKALASNVSSNPPSSSNWSGVTLNESSSHSPGIAVMSNGYVATLFTRNNNTSLLYCYSKNGGSTWTKNIPIGEATGHGPSLAADSNGYLFTTFIKNGDTQILFSKSQPNMQDFTMCREANFYLYDTYANQSEPYTVAQDQFKKFLRFDRGTDNVMFLLSWTCTSPDCLSTNAPYINNLLYTQTLWTDNEPIDQSTGHAPAIAVGHNDTLFTLFVSNGHSDLLLCSSTNHGKTWSNNTPINQSTGHAPSLACDSNGYIYAAFTANNSNSDILISKSSNTSGTSWSNGNHSIGYASNSTPGFAINQSTNALYIIFTDKNNSNTLTVCTSTNTGSSWSKIATLTGQTSSDGASLAIDASGNLYALYTDSNNNIQCIKSTNSGTTWSSPVSISEASGKNPALAINTAGTLCCLFLKNNGNSILYCQSTDGGATWSGNVTTDQSSGMAPSLASGSNSMLYSMFVKNGGNSLLFYTSGGGALQDMVTAGWATAAKKPNILYVDYLNNTPYQFVQGAEFLNSLQDEQPKSVASA